MDGPPFPPLPPPLPLLPTPRFTLRSPPPQQQRPAATSHPVLHHAAMASEARESAAPPLAPSDLPPAKAKRVVEVTGVSSSATRQLLIDFFSFHGKIEECTLSRSGNGGGFVGYIQFSNASAAKSALLFDKANFLSHPIGVQMSDYAMPRSEPSPQDTPPPASAPSPAVASSETCDSMEQEAVVVERLVASWDDNECFEKVEQEDAEEPGSRPPPEEGVSTDKVKHEAEPEPDAFLCFRQLAQEPLNQPQALLFLTITSFLAMMMEPKMMLLFSVGSVLAIGKLGKQTA
ncbi:hypothetical protein AB1Y20_013994 [Prymnesium parvum]|uniref:RRM domain-containing protein n=1 Tax=Prymnesium parvum TaxID=97485 RepID=A0AB34IGX7_PRYPA